MDYKLKPEEELARIQNVFGAFFERHHFRLRSANIQEFLFENDHSQLMFDFDNYGMRWGYMAPPTVIYINKQDDRRYSVKKVIEKLHGIDFEKVFDGYWRIQQFGYYETWHKMISEYLDAIIIDNTFSWAEDFNDKTWN